MKPMREDQAISALHQLAKRWPKSLTLFSNMGALLVIRDYDGKTRGADPGGTRVATIHIPNDGGDCQFEEE